MTRTFFQLTLLIALASCAVSETSALAPQDTPPPRMVGNLAVDKHTAAPLQVLKRSHVLASPESVYSALLDTSNWTRWFPGLELVGTSGTGVGSTRSLKNGGASVTQKFVALTPSSAIAWSDQPGNPYGMQDHLAVFHLLPGDRGGTIIEWHQFFDHENAAEVGAKLAMGMQVLLAGLVGDHGGTHESSTYGTGPVTIKASRVVNVPREKVWEAAAVRFAKVHEWASTVEHSELKQASRGRVSVGDERSCSTSLGGFRERVLTMNKSRWTFSYEVFEGIPPFVEKAVNTWTVETLGEDTTRFTMTLVIDVRDGTPQQPVGFVKGGFTQAVNVTADDFVHFVERSEPHPRKLAAGNSNR